MKICVFFYFIVCTLPRLLEWQIGLIVTSAVCLIFGGVLHTVIFVIYKWKSESCHLNLIAGLFCSTVNLR